MSTDVAWYRRNVVRSCVWLGLAMAFAYAPAVDAQDVRALVQRGTEAFETGRLDEAIAFFRSADALSEHPVIDFNLARALEANGALAEARTYYEGYLRARPDDTDARARLNGLIARLEAVPVERPRDPPNDPADPDAVDEDEDGAVDPPSTTTSRPSLTPGRLTMSLAGLVLAGAAASLGVGFAADRAASDSPESHRAAFDDYERSRRAYIAGDVLVGVGVVLLVTGTILWIRARRARGDQGSSVAFRSFSTIRW